MPLIGGFPAITWGSLRERRAMRMPGGYWRAVLSESDAHLVTATWWPRGAVSEAHGHGASHASMRVLEGELLEERWNRGDDGAWRYAHRLLRTGQASELAAGAIHRLVAIRPTSAVTSFSPPALKPLERIEPRVMRVLELARAGVLESSSTAVELRAPLPEEAADSDA